MIPYWVMYLVGAASTIFGAMGLWKAPRHSFLYAFCSTFALPVGIAILIMVAGFQLIG